MENNPDMVERLQQDQVRFHSHFGLLSSSHSVLLTFPYCHSHIPILAFSHSHSLHRFCDKEGMAEYIAPEQLLVKFGGNDPWLFDYDSERERIEQEVCLSVCLFVCFQSILVPAGRAGLGKLEDGFPGGGRRGYSTKWRRN